MLLRGLNDDIGDAGWSSFSGILVQLGDPVYNW